MKIGFIGLGRMGAAMARNLLQAGHEVSVYNRSRDKSEALMKQGAQLADSPGAACRDAEAVITMLADDHAVEQVVFGENGIASALKTGSTHISNSTISTALARRLAMEHGNRGQSYVSAPVLGRPDSAESKKLVVMAAGPEAAIERCRPLLEAIGRKLVIVDSEPWRANAVKLCVNFTLAAMIETLGEAFATMRKSGVDHHLFLEIVNELYGSNVYKNYGSIIADEKFEPAGFALKLGLKDARLVLQAAEECACPMPLASIIRDRFLSAVAHGQGEMDWASMAMVAARDAGL